LLAGEPGDLEGFVRDGGTPPAHGLMPSWQRLAGYLMACRDAGIVPDIGMIRRVGVYSVDAAKAAVLDLLASRRRPTGLFTGDGTMSTGAMEAIRALGLAVPADLSLVCFDDLDWMRFLDGGITAASQPARALGAAATELLLRRMQGGREPEQHVVIPVPLVERASVARPARRLPETARSKVDNA
jgi:LacI family transcriptional regulator